MYTDMESLTLALMFTIWDFGQRMDELAVECGKAIEAIGNEEA